MCEKVGEEEGERWGRGGRGTVRGKAATSGSPQSPTSSPIRALSLLFSHHPTTALSSHNCVFWERVTEEPWISRAGVIWV